METENSSPETSSFAGGSGIYFQKLGKSTVPKRTFGMNKQNNVEEESFPSEVRENKPLKADFRTAGQQLVSIGLMNKSGTNLFQKDFVGF